MISHTPSDFRDLVDTILQLDAASACFLKDLNLLCDDKIQSSAVANRAVMRYISEMATDLERQYSELNTHYGWVLASDYMHVNGCLRSLFKKDVDGKDWFKEVFERQAATRSALKEMIGKIERVLTA